MRKRCSSKLVNFGKLLMILLVFAIIAAVSTSDRSSNIQASPAVKPAGLDNDYCSPELRAKVEQLKADVAAERTTPKNSAERLPVLWEWANERTRGGHNIPNDLPLAIYYDRFFADMIEQAANDKELSFFERLKTTQKYKFNGRFILRLVDRYVREMQMLEDDPHIFGSVSAQPMEFPAASYQTIEQTYTVGNRDLEPGAYLVVAQHIMSTQGKYQIDDPKADNYVSAHSSNASAKFKPTTKRKFGMHGSERFPSPNLAFELVEGRLTKGDTVTVVYGDQSGGSRGFKVHAISNDAFQIPLYVGFGDEDRSLEDVILDIGYDYMLGMVPFRVVGIEPVGVHGFAPSIVGVGEPFEVSVRSEDRYSNRAEGEIPAYDVTLNGEPFGAIDAGGEAITLIKDIKIDEPGVYRFGFNSKDGKITGQSNPIWVQENPKGRIYWGETHGHSGFAEGQGTPEGYFRFGRDDARLDFLTLSEHDLWLDDREWRILKDHVAEFTVEGEFITYAGYEWTSNGPFGGHHNVLFRNPDGRERQSIQEHPYLQDLYKALRENNDVKDVLIIPHCHEAGDWRMTDSEMENLVEIFSMHGSFEWFGRMYLKQGHRVGFIAASDDHLGHPGYSSAKPRRLAQRGGLAAVMAPEKTRDSIFDAMKNLSAYATTGKRMILDVDVNGAPMGSIAPISETATVSGRVLGTAPIDTITIMKNDAPIWSKDFRSASKVDESGNTLVEVVFFSTSTTPEGRFDNPRGWRPWEGSLVVEGASLISAKSSYYNPILPQTRQDPQNSNKVNFVLQTRGDEYRILLKLEGASSSARIDIKLDEAEEIPTAKSRIRPPEIMPAAEFSLSFGDIEGGRLTHELAADIYTDTVSLRLVNAQAPLDQEFEFVDPAKSQQGDYYYVSVKQSDSAMAWSSPLWIGSASK